MSKTCKIKKCHKPVEGDSLLCLSCNLGLVTYLMQAEDKMPVPVAEVVRALQNPLHSLHDQATSWAEKVKVNQFYYVRKINDIPSSSKKEPI